MNKKIQRLVSLLVLASFVLSCAGCESFRRKFVRKRKTSQAQEEMIVVPRDYSANPLPPEVLYKQYFVYWRSWNQELVSSLNDAAPYKKIKECVEQAIVNLTKMGTYLQDAKAKELGVYAQKTEQLKNDIEAAKSLPPAQMASLRYKAERILSAVNREFDLRKVKDFLR